MQIDPLEEQVCAAAPWDAKAILPYHSSLAALIAGFALTAFILLLDRGHDHTSDESDHDSERRRVQANASLLLILAATTGIVAAYLFSSFAGDHCMNAQVQFQYPSTLLVISATLMVSGIGVAASSVKTSGHVPGTVRAMVFIAGSLMLIRIAVDMDYIARAIHALRDLGVAEPLDGARDGSPSYSERLERIAGGVDLRPASPSTPARLAERIFMSEAETGFRRSAIYVGAFAVVLACWTWWRLLPTVPRPQEQRWDHATALRREGQWRAHMTITTVVVSAVLVLMASMQGLGETLVLPANYHWVVALVCAVLVMVPALQPPIAKGEATISTWIGRTRIGSAALDVMWRMSALGMRGKRRLLRHTRRSRSTSNRESVEHAGRLEANRRAGYL